MQLAKERYEGKVIVVDSTFVCYPVIYMLKAAQEMLAKGYTCTQIKEKIEKEGELYAILIPENLTTLKNGGRISPAAAALAGMLKIHPLLLMFRIKYVRHSVLIRWELKMSLMGSILPDMTG